MLEYNEHKKRLSLIEILFVICIFFSFLSERTLFGRVSLLLFCSFAFITLLYNRGRMRFSAYFLLEAVFVFYCLMQNLTGYSYNVSESQKMLFTYLLCVIFYFSVFCVFSFSNDFDRILRIVFKVFYVAIIVNFLCDIDKIFSGRFNSNDGISILGMKIGGVIAITLGWIAGVCLFLNLYLYKVKSRNNKIYWFNFLFFTITMFLSGTRKTLLLVLFVMILQMFFESKNGNIFTLVKVISVVASISLVVLLLLFKVPILYDAIGNRIESMFLSVFEGDQVDSSMITRESLLERAKDLFNRRPWTGWGLNGFMILTNLTLHCHNNFYELLVGVGLVGTALYYLKYVFLLAALIKKYKRAQSSATKKTCILFIFLIVLTTVLEIWQVCYFTRKFMLFHIIALSYAVLENEENADENSIHSSENAYKSVPNT